MVVRSHGRETKLVAVIGGGFASVGGIRAAVVGTLQSIRGRRVAAGRPDSGSEVVTGAEAGAGPGSGSGWEAFRHFRIGIAALKCGGGNSGWC